MMNRAACKFGPNCNKFKMGQDCGYAHDGIQTEPPLGSNSGFGSKKVACRFGASCQKMKLGQCGFAHDASNLNGVVVSQGKDEFGKAYCKFGQHCNNWKKGVCTYPHPTVFSGQINNNNNKPECRFGQSCKNFAMGTCTFAHSGKPQIQQYSNDFQNKICRQWVNGQCDSQKICKRNHRFTVDDSFVRVFFDNTFPNVKNSDIALFNSETCPYIILKMGTNIFFLRFNFQESTLQKQNFSHTVPQILSTFKIQGNFLLYSFENPTSKLQNLYIYNVIKNEEYKINNAHQKSITGITMLNQSTVISVSKDSLVKTWVFNINKKQFELNKELSEKLQKSYEGLKIELSFCKICFLQTTQLLCVGTLDSKLFIWDISTAQFNAITTGSYANLIDIEFKDFGNGNILGLILASGKNSSALLRLTINDLAIAPIIQQKQNPITKFLITNELLFLCHLKSGISIYKLPDLNRIGAVPSNNQMTNLLYKQSTTSTQITFKNIIAMESCRQPMKDEKCRGSVSIFRIAL